MFTQFMQSSSLLSRSYRPRPTSTAFPRSSRAMSYSFGTVHAAPPRSRLSKYARRSGYMALGFGTVWLVDKEYNASAIGRNFRTLWTCVLITLDYKINFQPSKADHIPDLHERVAGRMYDLFTSNGGLYIKIGQAIGANAALLPRAMQDKFSRLFDDAPQIPYSTILSVFKSEFGKPPSGSDGIFEVFEEKAVASASVAQVHRAKLKSGEWVAVKVQKPDVNKQIEWDLGAFRAVMWMFEHWVFDLPVYFAVDFISDHLRQELDFVQEAKNASKTAEFVAAEPRLAGSVHIPKVYAEYSTKKVMTAEWIDGVRLSDRGAIRRLMGESDSSMSIVKLSSDLEGVQLNGGLKAIMQTMVELFSAQMFNWGWVHCDPHPGNIIIRPHPSDHRRPQLVLLDHGLYVRVSEDFKRQYATLWRGLLAADFSAIEGVTREWGIGTPDLFASATLMKPMKFKNGNGNGNRSSGGENFEGLNEYERSVRMKAKLKNFLLDTDKMPKELIFLGRNMRMVQGNNQSLGTPVNRIKITGYWASRSLTRTPNLPFLQRLKEYWHYFIFRSIMFSVDVFFWTSKLRQQIKARLGQKGEDFEDELERTMRGFAKSNLGVDVAPNAFEG
ncbi:hypothetical protein SERLA73DRAFT_110371 [Serpula lacrymans var. lacrymans S7.3]|uniref:ABC1 atypical kinase-like domain-containing protein n=2 Tax=Serpula lacrymans var. lacrymans TaxID=341189 RepID=F8Q1Y9_SERL3|nr:uncharacterized protein SERLADRAFT_471249 [Serpula lacrymans var. lacrymans S7.9]EGN97200.1 hypothetical protein SERLA73DRAFT_110371 [Serpula lacrymans var. lacrymans S7.3]EGO22807.1 hypothetical protein SERLADRAFT_471249 [Serpula lacrymans var. lacrymans S7.9]